jgi:hypothetical protein
LRAVAEIYWPAADTTFNKVLRTFDIVTLYEGDWLEPWFKSPAGAGTFNIRNGWVRVWELEDKVNL